MGDSKKIKYRQLSNMSKLGCSLKEAYGTSWTAGPKYYQAPPSAFQTIDPYGPNPRSEQFTNNTNNQINPPQIQQKMEELEELLNKIRKNTALTKEHNNQVTNFTNESHNDIASELYNMLCSPVMKDRIDCLIKFVLCSLLVANMLELLSINA
uniref:Uncharacterized protein n=1 Tax=viral metagenome TaxID=1070528 RepID=A0A6C0FC85_9ZZZZ|tara:strand:- start:13779 stop:14237 length:459 start_codon:yes stop_codon:yes gene_type:complete